MPNQTRLLRWGKLFIVIILCGLFSTQAVAASFDCKKATTWVEKVVCSDPELSKLDEELAKTYHDALTSLSPEGQRETKEYQRQWLKQLPGCPSDGCLEYSYKERIEQLQHSLIKFPDRIFRNVHVYYEKLDKTCPFGITVGDLTYPQIENPRNENEKWWNDFISKQATDHFVEECVQSHDNYAVSFSNKHLISVERMNSTFTEDAPAPRRAAAVSISLLLEDYRKLEASDLFDDETDWPHKIAALASQKLQEKKIAQELELNRQTISSPEIMYKVTSPVEWVISRDGLGFGFHEFYLRGFSYFITIDWKTLDPYLSKTGHSLIYD